MLKENAIRGMITIIYYSNFLGIVGAMPLSNTKKANPKIAYSADTAKVSSGNSLCSKLADISPEPIFPVNDKTEVWLVQYKDDMLEFKRKGDKQIAKLVEQANKES